MRVLWPNFGAEERDVPPPPSPRLHLLELVRAWERAVVVADDHGFVSSGFVPWLNTPRAQAEADARGLPLFGADPDVVREVHDKAFCARVRGDDGIETVILAPQQLTAEETARHAGKVAKPRFSTSGRGRVTIPAGGLTETSCRKLAERGGAVVEPWLTRGRDLSTQWWIDDARVQLLGSTLALQRESGVWRGASVVVGADGAITSGVSDERRLVEQTAPIAEAAAARGYRGPCGVDAFVYFEPRDDDGAASSTIATTTHLRVCELNARFTAGFVALFLARAVARPGQRMTWLLGRDPVVEDIPAAGAAV